MRKYRRMFIVSMALFWPSMVYSEEYHIQLISSIKLDFSKPLGVGQVGIRFEGPGNIGLSLQIGLDPIFQTVMASAQLGWQIWYLQPYLEYNYIISSGESIRKKSGDYSLVFGSNLLIDSFFLSKTEPEITTAGVFEKAYVSLGGGAWFPFRHSAGFENRIDFIYQMGGYFDVWMYP